MSSLWEEEKQNNLVPTVVAPSCGGWPKSFAVHFHNSRGASINSHCVICAPVLFSL